MLLQLAEPGQIQSSTSSPTAIGIDLGTTHSVVAVSQGQQTRILTTGSGESLIPSVVFYPDNEPVMVGSVALKHLKGQGLRGIRSVKRLMSPHPSYAPEHRLLIDDETSTSLPRLHFGALKKTPIEVSADILKSLKEQAETALGYSIHEAVITVPAYFDDAARQATKDAATLAGLKTLRLINEPTAAALAYGLDYQLEGIYAIYDLGGGTFDLSLLRLHHGIFQVLATGGHTHLGGDDIDLIILNHWLNSLGPDVAHLVSSIDCLQLAQQAKHHLTFDLHGTWTLPGTSLEVTLDRFTLDRLCAPLVEKTLTICQQVLLDAKLPTTDIQGVVLVGGSTRMPSLRKLVADFFKRAPLTDVNPDEVVARGAALQAEALTKGTNSLLLDVTPLSLGIETMGGLVEKIIPRNSPIPTRIAQEFTTFEEGQTQMKIHVVQGERERVDHCRSLGEFILKGIPPMTAGTARIEVVYVLDTDGLLTVSAQEKITGMHQSIDIKPSYGLSEGELDRLLRENYHHGQQDLEERLLIETRLEAEQLCRVVEKALNKDGDLLESPEIAKINLLMETLQSTCLSSHREVIQEHAKALTTATINFAEKRLSRAIKQNLDSGH
jgi:molecular chaperone HscA